MVPVFSKIRTYIAKIKIWLVSQLDWTKLDTEQVQVTGKADDNASLLLLKSKMFLILFLRKVGYGASVAVLALVMFSLPIIFSGPAQNSDTVSPHSQFLLNYCKANSLWGLMDGKGDFYLQNLYTDFYSFTRSHTWSAALRHVCQGWQWRIDASLPSCPLEVGVV